MFLHVLYARNIFRDFTLFSLYTVSPAKGLFHWAEGQLSPADLG